jgi:hypothetical protein
MKIIEKESKNIINVKNADISIKQIELTNKCEAWCKEHKSCNLEIVKESVSVKEKIDL